MNSVVYSHMRFPVAAISLWVFALSMTFVMGATQVEGSTPEIYANDNRKSAGRLVGETMRIELEAREGLWYPESRDGPGLPVQAFAERDDKLLVPGPLIRVPEGTRVRATVRNMLAEKLVLHGFHARPGYAQDTS